MAFLRNLYLDLETYNSRDTRAGTYVYAETAEVLLFAYALGDGPIKVVDCTERDLPDELMEWLHDSCVLLTAHNAQFDRIILKHALNLPLNTKRWRCTMVKALSHGFPGSLAGVGGALGLGADKAKLSEGKKLINRFCKPAPANHKLDRYDRSTHPEEWQKFMDYAAQDIEAMREIDRLLPWWNWKDKDIALYHLDQRINDRGFLIDTELAGAGLKASNDEKTKLAQEFLELTNGEVERPSCRKKFKTYLNTRFNLNLDNTRAETFNEMLTGRADLHPDCRRLMELSCLANKTSTAKYAAVAPAVSRDGRFRGGLQFRGAARTRRWAGRVLQPQNLPSRGLPPQRSIDIFIEALKQGEHEFLFNDLTRYASAALRGLVIAPPNRKLVVADLANIEGRVLAWLAGETWKIDAFKAFDKGTGPDLYAVTAAGILGLAPRRVSKADRDAFGKVPELALGYAAGFNGLQTFARAYSVSFAEHWETIARNVQPALIAKAAENYSAWGQAKNPLSDKTEWIASETVKLAWRARHPKIVAFWKAVERAARDAILWPGKTFEAGPHLVFACRQHEGHNYLLCRLPSMSVLTYFRPHYDPKTEQISHMGTDVSHPGGTFGKWRRLKTYGGRLVENACQSLALDVLAENMSTIEAKGFSIVLTAHDEIVAETADKSAEELAALMARPTNGLMHGLPLSASGFECQRYRKG